WFKQRIRRSPADCSWAGRGWLLEMMGRTRWTGRFCVAAMAAMLGLLTNWQARAENENFSNKPPPALFNADCTGAGCHKGPQGLGKGQSQSSLAGFLREHYTNSRQSAANLAAYILKMPAGPEPREARTPARPAARGEPAGSPGWEGFFGGTAERPAARNRPAANEPRTPTPSARSSRAAVNPTEDEKDREKEAAKEKDAAREAAKEAAKDANEEKPAAVP